MAETIRIIYWVLWEPFISTAASLAASIKDKFNLEAELIKDSGGIFTVSINDVIINDNKGEETSLPKEEEVIQKIGKYIK